MIYNSEPEFDNMSSEHLELPDIEELSAAIKLTRDCCIAHDYDNINTFPIACVMNMASNVLQAFESDNPELLWNRLVVDMRWLASWAIDTYPDRLSKESLDVLSAIQESKGDVICEAVAQFQAEMAGSTARLQ
jgi:hypothetical protein